MKRSQHRSSHNQCPSKASIAAPDVRMHLASYPVSSPRSVLSVLSNIGPVYCPIHWSLAAEVFDASKRLMIIFTARCYFKAQYLVSHSISLRMSQSPTVLKWLRWIKTYAISTFHHSFLTPNVVQRNLDWWPSQYFQRLLSSVVHGLRPIELAYHLTRNDLSATAEPIVLIAFVLS